MSYDIYPQDMDRVSRQTGTERERLGDTMVRVPPNLVQAQDATRAAPGVATELGHFLDLFDGVLRDVLGRVEAVLANGGYAVDAYVHGDADMAAQYARNSAVFTGVVALPPAGPTPLPQLVSGG